MMHSVIRPQFSRARSGPAKAPPVAAGEWVQVASAQEIAASLDKDGKLDGVPFMPEMLRFCGQRLRVHRRAEKTCVEGHGLRRMEGTVLLQGARCDGAGHDGCQRGCMIFWKEAWLQPVDGGAALNEPDPIEEADARLGLASAPTRDGDRYLCQSTALAQATGPLSKWSFGLIAGDVRRGELSIAGFLDIVWRTLANLARRKLGLPELGVFAGAGSKGPAATLGLKPGEWVKVRPVDQIEATLGPNGKHRGLSFEPEMGRYIGGTYRVGQPVERIILEETGKMVDLRNTVTLETLTCQGSCVKNCPRANPLFWREAWLERADPPRMPSAAPGRRPTAGPRGSAPAPAWPSPNPA